MEMGMTMITVALVNTVYRLAIVLSLSPVTGLIERIVGFLFPVRADEAAERADMDRLESRFLTHPALALAQSRAVIDSMAEKALQSVTEAISVRRNTIVPV